MVWFLSNREIIGATMEIKVHEELSLEVDYHLPSRTIVQRSGVSEKHWHISERISIAGSRSRRVPVKAHIVSFDEDVTVEKIHQHLGDEYRLAGAWEREAYLRAFPEYREDLWSILFPALEWTKVEHEGMPYCTEAWHDRGNVGPRGFASADTTWRAGRKIMFLCVAQ